MNFTLYFVECDFGKLGRAFIEIDRDTNSRQSIVADIVSGQIENVTCILEVTDDCPARDVTEDVALDVAAALDRRAEGCPGYLKDWLDQQIEAGTADRLEAGELV